MKKFFSFFVAALFCTYAYADLAVTVNPNGTATQGHFPVFGDNADSKGQKMQAIYLADQLKSIAVGSEIKALTFYSSKQSQSWGKAEFKVSLAKTDYTFFQNASGAYASASEGSSLTKVYEGPLSVADGELAVNFTSPYAYEGGNLLIQVEITTAGSYSSSSFYSAANTDYLIKYATSGSSREAKQPKLTFVIADGGSDPVSATCKAPTAVTVESVTESMAAISWQGEASQYQYCLEFEGAQPDWTAAKLTDQKSVLLLNLYEEETYYFYVRSYCSETEVSETVKVTFKTACGRLNVPWIETFTRDAAGSETAGDVAPECWIISSANPAVTIVAEKEDDGEGNQKPTGQQYLNARGGGATTAQVFALPLFNAQLDTCELAFDYRTSVVNENYASLEIGYMTNPADAASFVSLNKFEQTTTSQHVVFPLNVLPAGIQYIAFRFAGGTSDFGSVSMDNFVLAGIGHSDEVSPDDEVLPDASIYGLTYCEAQFVWYSYTAENFAIGLFSVDNEALISGVVVTGSECDRFAYEDGVAFSEYDDYENKYYCSTKWILNVDEEGMQKGDAWSKCVININTAASPVLALRPGKYYVQIFELVQSETGYAKGAELAKIPFELAAKQIENLVAVVAEDHQTATLTWDTPELGSGERVFASVRSGETVVFDNYNDTKVKAVSPLNLNVEEGRTYNAYFQIVDRNMNPLGPEVQCNFTVGVNLYEPKNLNAEVFGGDNVTFTWTADAAADRYVITLYLNGEFYTTLTVSGTTKTTTMPADGTWSWTIQAFNQGSNGSYFEASNEVAGNDFVSKAADVPEDAVVLNVADFNAFLIDQDSKYYQEGKNAWVLIFRTGEEDAPGYPIVWFLVYTAKERAISGVYNTSRDNIDLESSLLVPSANAGQNDYVFATDAEVRLQFDGYDEEKYESGYTLAYYTGSFRLVGNDGKTYIAKFMEQFCYSGNYDMYEAGNASYEGMYDEDPTYDPFQGIEEVVAATPNGKKVLYNNQLLIIRDGKAYNVLGTLVK